MKRVKAFAISVLAACMVFSLAACGSSDDEERTVVMSGEISMDGTPIMETITMRAIGDTIQTQHEVMEIDLSAILAANGQSENNITEEDIEPIVELMTEIFQNTYGNIDAITIEDISATTTTLTITLVYDYTGDNTALEKAGFVDAGFFQGDETYVSLIKSQQGLEAQGFRVIEE